VRFRRADGVYRWFQIAATPVNDEHGNLIHWYGINTDIDDRKRAEQALRQTEGELRTIIDAIRQEQREVDMHIEQVGCKASQAIGHCDPLLAQAVQVFQAFV